MKYSLLIIDDESDRNPAYNQLLVPAFELEIQNDIISGDLDNAINDAKIDCIILDMVLSTAGDPDKELFDKVMSLVGTKKPVILISRSFNIIASWISNESEKSNIIGFVGWDELYTTAGKIKDNGTAMRFQTRTIMALNRYYKRSTSIKSPDDSILMVHLSDFQFGDPEFLPDAVLSETIIAGRLGEIYQRNFDLVIASGDIAYSGLPSEFDLGYTWLTEFTKLILPQNFNNIGERILLCPGNHDVNLSLNAADYFTFDFAYKADPGAHTSFLKPREKPIADHTGFGLMPFLQFAYKVTKDIRWIDNEYGNCFINDKFIAWGLRFIHLNTVMELGYLTSKKISVISSKIKKLVHDSAPVSNKVVTIIIAHNCPEDLGFVLSADIPQSAADVFSMINSIRGNLFLYGHRHKVERVRKIPYEGVYTTSIDYSQAGTISLNNKLKPNDSRRSFSILELFRKDGIVTGCDIKVFEIDGQYVYEVEYKKSVIKWNH